jgi:hypothetical protein
MLCEADMGKSAKKRPSSPAKGNSFSKWLSSVPAAPSTGPVTIKVPVPMHRWLWFQIAEAAAVNGKSIGEVIEYVLYRNGAGLTDWSNDGFKM